MASLIKRSTNNFNLGIPRFDIPNWGAVFERNMDIIDAILATTGVISGIIGDWQNNTSYGVDDRVVDAEDNSVWQCTTAHVSSLIPTTFAQDRANNPGRWDPVVSSVVPRGEFVHGADYFVGDFVYDSSEYLGGVVISNFTGNTNLRNDIGNIGIIYDIKSDLQEAVDAKNDAEAARDKAYDWAEEDEDIPVETGEYSAKHWAAKADEIAQTVWNQNQQLVDDAVDLLNLSGVPVGMVTMQNGAVDPGFLRIGEGGTYDRATYPELATWMDANGEVAFGLSAQDVLDGVLPDWRDYSPRTAGGLLGPDVGDTQEDAMQRITGEMQGRVSDTGGQFNWFVPTGALSTSILGGTSATNMNATTPSATDREVISFDSGNSPGARVSDDETRVKSFGVRWQIKAYGAFVNQGMVDLVALEQAVANLSLNAVRSDVVQSLSPEAKARARQNIGALGAGAVQSFAMNTAPDGWLKANGAIISRDDYADLFAVIGTTFGVGDGSTTFALPDLRGEFIRGWSDGRSGVDAGRAFGSGQSSQNLSHTHPFNDRSVGSDGGSGGVQTGSGRQLNYSQNKTTSSSGGNEARPRNVALLICIKY